MMRAPTCRAGAFQRLLSAAALGVALLLGSGARGQDVVIGMRSGPVAVDPHYSAAGPQVAAMRNIFEALVKRSSRMELQPSLAESWHRIDGTTWEFRLRRGVLWHDGTPFTAADVKFSIERIPTVGQGGGGLAAHVASIIATVILDDHTVRFRTDGPAPTLPAELDRIFMVQSRPNTALSTGDSAVGTGPYRYVSWDPQDSLVLERFDYHWHEAKPHFRRVVFREIPDDATRVAALLAGDVDLIEHVPAPHVAALRRAPNMQVVHVPSVYVFLLHPDGRDISPLVTDNDGRPLTQNPLRDLRVRRALSLAIDRTAMAREVMEGLSDPASTPLPASFFGVPQNAGALRHDPAEARSLLAAAGYPRGFRVQLHCTSDRFAGDARICTALGQSLAQIGVSAEVLAQSAARHFTGFAQGDFSLAMNGWGTLSGDATYMLATLLHSRGSDPRFGGFNRMRYTNAEIDRLTRMSLEVLDEGERRRVVEQGIRVAMDDLAVIPIVTVPAIWAANSRRASVIGRMDEDTLAVDAGPPMSR